MDASVVREPAAEVSAATPSEGLSFEAFVAARSRVLLRSAYLLTGEIALAEDLLQTAWSKVWPRWDRLVRAGNPEAYVRRVLFTTYATWWRRKWVAERPTAEVPDVVDADDHAVAAVRRELLDALAGLPRGQRAVVVLRYFEDRTETETAAALGCSVGTVKSKAARAMERLRQSPLLSDPSAPEEISP